MARNISEIKKEMTDTFITNETVIGMYGLDITKSFENQFSKVSVESIIFYIVAVAVWTLEKLFDVHKTEVANIIDTQKPHRLTWYILKTKAFQFGRALITDSDVYNNTGVSPEQIEAEQVVKYAAALELRGTLQIKVAGETTLGIREPLPTNQEVALEAYLKDIKDAGVQIELINMPANSYSATIDIYYDPMILSPTLSSLADGGTPVFDAIKYFIENLPFNGEYRNAALVDTLQIVQGVVIPELLISKIDGQTINAKSTPSSGYLKIVNESDLILNPKPYETISD